MTREEIEKLIRPFIAGVVQGTYRFKTTGLSPSGRSPNTCESTMTKC
jgi:hypothetical protein